MVMFGDSMNIKKMLGVRVIIFVYNRAEVSAMCRKTKVPIELHRKTCVWAKSF